jgi:hypothetical protein
VQFKAFADEYTHYFLWVSQAERDTTDDNNIFWYPPEKDAQ